MIPTDLVKQIDENLDISRQIRRGRSAFVGVLSENNANRLVAVQAISAGTKLFRIEGERTETPTRYSLQIGKHLHLDLTGEHAAEDIFDRYFWRFLNHSCAPNTRIRDQDVITIRDIATGEDVTFDYNTTEYAMFEPFECHCGDPSCIKVVRGFKYLTAAQQQRLRPLLAPYLIGLLDRDANA